MTDDVERPIDLLLVDDDDELRDDMTRYFSRRGYNISECACGEQALEFTDQRAFDVIILDMMMPGMTGLELLEKLKQRGNESEVVMLTGQGTIETAVEAMKLGASEYLTKPASLKDLDTLVRKGIKSRFLRKENDQLKAVIKQATPEPQGMIGESPKMKEVFRLIERTADSRNPILIQGESGTGKELVARAIHKASPLSDKPLVVINCAALPETLLESELFGHEKGAFTGAVSSKPGLFEVADGGTLFIDEFGELAGPLQAKMLRVLEDGSLRRVGSVKERRVQVRIIAATNRDMEKEVSEGRFREDLYYRINVLTIHLPPLRERAGDIPLLVERLIGPEWTIEPDVIPLLERYGWPGNVRQLINALERAKILASDETIRLANLPPEIVRSAESASAPAPGTSCDLDTLNKLHVEEIYRRHNGNKARTARALGIGRRSLYRLLEKYEIGPPQETANE
ncbi:MAG: sigma-54-dependent Fis family transcriptional regulator [Planctomycetales bacterium]|nr:sigma-54-dependent Fis family transcriptional regulator [Planctomycetales bacterium]